MFSKILIGIVLFLIFGGIVVVSGKREPTPKLPEVTSSSQLKNTVIFTKGGFSPQTLTIKKDEEVKWLNENGGELSVNSDPDPEHSSFPPLNIGEIENNGSKNLDFNTSGTFGYHNHFNPSQNGTIIVQ